MAHVAEQKWSPSIAAEIAEYAVMSVVTLVTVVGLLRFIGLLA